MNYQPEHDEVSVEEAYIVCWQYVMGFDIYGDKVSVSDKVYQEAIAHLRSAPESLAYVQTDLYETYSQEADRIFGRGNWDDSLADAVGTR